MSLIPILFPNAPKWFLTTVFYSGLIMFIVLMGSAIYIATGAEEEQLIHSRKIIALVLMIACSIGFVLSMRWFMSDPKRPTLGLELKIGGVLFMGVFDDSTRLQLTVNVINHGQATTAHRWKLIVKTSTGEWETRYMPGEKPAKDSLSVPPLDEVLRKSLGTNSEVVGLLNFLLPKISQSAVKGLINDSTATLVLSVLDNANNEWVTERSISEMAKERITITR